VKDRMVSIAGGLESTAWCGLLLWVVVCAKVEWVFAPFSTWFQGKWDNLWCDGWFHFHGTCSMQVSLCMGLGHDCGHDLGSRLFGCMGGGVFDRRSFGFFPVEMVRNYFLSSLVALNHQN
jgi:hypothetical protein